MIATTMIWEAIGAAGVVAALVGVAVAAFYAARGKAQVDAQASLIKTAQDTALAWKEERDAEVAKNDRLEAALKQEREQRATCEIELAKCLERTDLRPVSDTLTRLEDDWGRHWKDMAALVTGQFTQQATLLTTLTTAVVERLDAAAGRKPGGSQAAP